MDQRSLFDDPPAQRHSPTSVAAAEGIEPRAETLRRAVLEFLRQRGEQGATDEEIQDALAMPGNTARPRRRELQMAGLVVDSGNTRETRSGRQAVIWVAALKRND